MTTATLPADLNQLVQSELESGETIRWSAQPSPTSTGAGMTWGIFAFGIPWTAFAIFWTVMASGIFEHSRAHDPHAVRLVFALFGLPFIGVGCFLLTAPWRAKKKLAKAIQQTAYVITDRRAILIDNGFVAFGPAIAIMSAMPGASRILPQGTRVQSFRPDQLTNIERMQREDGSGDVLFAENPMVIHGQHGARTLSRIGFMSVPHVREVEKMLRDLAQPSTGDAGSAAPPVISKA